MLCYAMLYSYYTRQTMLCYIDTTCMKSIIYARVCYYYYNIKLL